MNRDTLKGRWLQLKGRLRQAFGAGTGNRSEQAKGGLEEVGGKLRTGVGKFEDDVDRSRRPTE